MSLRSNSRPVSIYAGMGGRVGGLSSMGGNRVRRAEPVRLRPQVVTTPGRALIAEVGVGDLAELS